MVVAVPIRHTDGRLLGALSARLSLERADNILRRFAPGDSGQVYLIGANANVITSTHASSGAVMAQSLTKEAMDRLTEKRAPRSSIRTTTATKLWGRSTRSPASAGR